MPDLHVVTTGLRFPEGPVAMPDGTVLVVEIEAGRLTRVRPDGSKETVAEPGGGPNGAAIGPDGHCYLCNNGGFEWLESGDIIRPIAQPDDYSGGRIERVDLDGGAVEVLYTECDGHPLRGPNDIVFDAHGGFYFTDLGKVRARDMDRGGLYYARADGSGIREIAHPVMTPNGIGLSPDGKTLYAAETEGGRLWAWTVTAPGELVHEPWPSPNGGRVLHCSGVYQRFDSLAVEAGGNICVATLINGGVTVIAPDGSSAEHVPMPDWYCTNICFGGPDLRTAWLTLSGIGHLVSTRWPRAGLALEYLNT